MSHFGSLVFLIVFSVDVHSSGLWLRLVLLCCILIGAASEEEYYSLGIYLLYYQTWHFGIDDEYNSSLALAT